jgi:hypothetical protein
MRASRVPAALVAAAFAIGLAHTGTTAHAQTKVDREEARKQYEQARVAFDLADYETAITHFTRAYELSLEPALIFNIAQANRLLGWCHRAVELYQQYVRVAPATEEADTARRHLESLRATCHDETPPPPAAKPAPTRAPAAATAVAPAPRTNGALRKAAWVGLATGLLVGGAAPLVYHWNQSRHAQLDIQTAALERTLPTESMDGTVRPRLQKATQDLADSIDTVDKLVLVGGMVGAAVALTSAGYLLFSSRGGAAPAPSSEVGLSVGVGVVPGATWLSLSGRY